jgi:hypothetical protein
VVVSLIIYSFTAWVVHYNTPGWEEVICEWKKELGKYSCSCAYFRRVGTVCCCGERGVSVWG